MVTKKAAIAANRFGLGARPGDLAEIGQDHEDWLMTQLDAQGSVPRDEGMSSAEILREYRRLQRVRNEARQSDSEQRADDAQQAYGQFRRSQYQRQSVRRYALAATTDSPFRERLVHFWTNHFAVSADKQIVMPLAGSFEEEAIRPHVTGRFLNMLLAAEKHPAMILYLDNQASIGPNSRAGRVAARRGGDRGLNENLAREILELHTLGVNGGYTQEDVTTFAKVLTGWSIGIDRDGESAGEFVFRSNTHEPGAKTLLGKRYAEDDTREGEAVMADLAKHPATAHFLAEKLARHFVADDPPADLVADLAVTYLDHDGDLNAVYEELVAAPAVWGEPLAKYKTPEDFLVSTFRAFNQQPDNPERLLSFLGLLGQRPYTPGSPAGWPDTMAHWDGGDALIKRIEWASAVAQGIGDRARPELLGDAILGPVLSDHTRTAISRAESSAQGLTLLLASPEFQRR